MYYKGHDTKITRFETSTNPILDLATNVSAILKHNNRNIDTENIRNIMIETLALEKDTM